ncbi:MAG: WhiB family transcriptional regulator [Rhodococcus sp.]|nr:WhiB family transcriptional regulator [Rhodococcus sp. (in: high G+C Gram-positive bacteria)]
MSAPTCRGVITTVGSTTATSNDTTIDDTASFIEEVASRRDLPCRSGDPDLWFADAPTQLEEAKALCGDCPIRQRCLAAALDRGEPWGVWGGEIFDQGTVIARKRPRGRPRKTPALAPQQNPATPLCA